MQRPPLLLLHGFLGSGADWDALRTALGGKRPVLTPDLPGHGPEPAPVTATEDSFEVTVAALLASAPAEPFDLLGYSLGGRLALGMLCAAPDRIRRAVIVGASPGLEAEGERAARRELDAVRAAALETLPFEVWLQTWYAAPLFDGLRASPAFAALLARRSRGHPKALASALEAWSPGRQPPLRQRLATCPVPALLMAGSHDAKFLGIAQGLAEANAAFETRSVPDAGHAPHLESPDEFHDAVRDWFDRP